MDCSHVVEDRQEILDRSIEAAEVREEEVKKSVATYRRFLEIVLSGSVLEGIFRTKVGGKEVCVMLRPRP